MTASAAALFAHRQLMTTLATSCAIGGIVGDDSSSISSSDNVSAARIRRSCFKFQLQRQVSAACIRYSRLNFKRQRQRQVNSDPSTLHQVGIITNANISVCSLIEYITCYCCPPNAASHRHPVDDTSRGISPSGHSTSTVRL